jgi:hypothetical protein
VASKGMFYLQNVVQHDLFMFLMGTLLCRCWAACFPLFFHGHMGREVSSSYKPTRHLSKDIAWLKGNCCHGRKEIMTNGWTLVQHTARLGYYIRKLLLPICSQQRVSVRKRVERKKKKGRKEKKGREEKRKKERGKRRKEGEEEERKMGGFPGNVFFMVSLV